MKFGNRFYQIVGYKLIALKQNTIYFSKLKLFLPLFKKNKDNNILLNESLVYNDALLIIMPK